MDSDQQIAFIGLGRMGTGMALRLQSAAQRPITVFNRTSARTVPLAEAGARVARSPAEAVRTATVVILSLSDQAAVEQMLFGAPAAALRPGVLIIDTSTVSPAFSAAAAARLARSGAHRIEACVLGNPDMAASGQLRIFTAGAADDIRRALEVLEPLGQEIQQVGPIGSAAALKLAFNLILGSQIAALAEAVTFAEHAGVDRDFFLTSVSRSGLSSPTLAFRAGLMRERRYDPAAFRTALMEKDLRLVMSEAARHGLALPVTAGACSQFTRTIQAGRGDSDAAAVAELRTPVRDNAVRRAR